MTSVAAHESSVVLVTGATGRHGGTGHVLVERLVSAGRRVRVLVRTLDHRVEALMRLGAEVVPGNLLDRKSLLPAFDGVIESFFTWPINQGVVSAAANFASAAREAGAGKRLVVMSMGAASHVSPSHLGRAQALAEELFDWAGLDLVVLRVAALFYENIKLLHGRSIREQDVIRNNFGKAPLPWIGARDAAALAASAILHPERFASSTVHYPPGSELLSHGQIARTLAEELGRPIEYEFLDTLSWRSELERQAEDNGMINFDMAQHIAALGQVFNERGRAPVRSPDPVELERLTGQAPETWVDIVRREWQPKSDGFAVSADPRSLELGGERAG